MKAKTQGWIFCKPASKRKGFTLLELLVVFAIIALLAALLLPTLSRAKQQAYSARCINNLRQLGVGLNLYTQDAGCYPPATTNGITGAWQLELGSLVPDSVFYCPLQQPPSPTFVQVFNWTGGNISLHYGYNVFGANYQGAPPYNPGLGGDVNLFTGSRTPTSANRVLMPAQMITLSDSATFLDVVFGVQPQANIPNQIYFAFPYIVSGFNIPGVGNWHNNGANLLFDDAHVRFAPQSFWIAASDQSRRLWNSDNLPHPEWW